MSSSALVLKTGSTDWIRDLVYLALPEGEARERALFDMIKQFAKMDPQDPEWLPYKLTGVECRAMENIAAGLWRRPLRKIGSAGSGGRFPTLRLAK